jgi:hypothetical protein
MVFVALNVSGKRISDAAMLRKIVHRERMTGCERMNGGGGDHCCYYRTLLQGLSLLTWLVLSRRRHRRYV